MSIVQKQATLQRYSHSDSLTLSVKSRLKSGNACYHSVQDFLSSSLLSRNTKINIYRIIILPVVMYGCVSNTEGGT
jgi:hypothetical protein